MRLAKTCLVLACFATVPALSGCSWFEGGCASAMPVITASQAYVADASTAVDEVEAAFDGVSLSAEDRVKLTAAIAAARKGIRIADQALKEAAYACSAPDPVALLKEFISAWALISPFIMGNSDRLAAMPGKAPVGTPAIVLEFERRGH